MSDLRSQILGMMASRVAASWAVTEKTAVMPNDPQMTTCPTCKKPLGQHDKRCQYYSRPQRTIPDAELKRIRNKKRGSLLREAGYGRGYGGDPRWIRAKFPGKDIKGNSFAKGEEVLYWPLTRTFMTGQDAKNAWHRFQAEKSDEEGMSYLRSGAADCSPPTCSDGTSAEYDDGKDAYVCPSTGEIGPNGPICRSASPERVASRFALHTDDEQLVAISEALKKNNILSHLVDGMASKARKEGVSFGFRDARDALRAWYAGEQITKGSPEYLRKQDVAWGFLTSTSGKKLVSKLTDMVGSVLKTRNKSVGFRDIARAVDDYMTL